MADSAFGVQKDVRAPWRAYLDELAPLRPDLHRYCVRLTGNAWEGEDLVQEALLRAFTQLGKLDADLAKLDHPRAYLARTATRLWIDAQRRRAREREILAGEAKAAERAERPADPTRAVEVRDAAGELLVRLAPRERAALLMKDVLDLSLEEAAAILQTSVAAVKSALQRGRGRLADAERSTPPVGPLPSRALVERFLAALVAKDLPALQAICSADLSVELVGGAEMDGFERARPFFEHAHFVLPALGFGANPRWELAEYLGEAVVLGFRTLDGVEGLNEIHRLEEEAGRLVRVRCYCFCPDTLRVVGEHLGLPALRKAYRSP
ncbi:MAG TPA: RNA polymerase sigma factor [Myxococcota bacterium]|nr:RNA polymerase sigma factor [Myxococcota bacterium]